MNSLFFSRLKKIEVNLKNIPWTDTTIGILFHFFTVAKALETIVLKLSTRVEFGKELLFHVLSENGPNLGELGQQRLYS